MKQGKNPETWEKTPLVAPTVRLDRVAHARDSDIRKKSLFVLRPVDDMNLGSDGPHVLRLGRREYSAYNPSKPRSPAAACLTSRHNAR